MAIEEITLLALAEFFFGGCETLGDGQEQGHRVFGSRDRRAIGAWSTAMPRRVAAVSIDVVGSDPCPANRLQPWRTSLQLLRIAGAATRNDGICHRQISKTVALLPGRPADLPHATVQQMSMLLRQRAIKPNDVHRKP